MKIFLILSVFLSLSVAAKTVRVVQAGKTFLDDIPDSVASTAYDDPEVEEKHKVETLVLAKGDKIKIVNRDEVAHNARLNQGEKVIFDVKVQDPGEKNDREIDLPSKGEYTIQCAIHPKMKLKVKVED